MSVERRARVHAALGEPARLAIVDRLVAGDASPGELGAAIGIGTNLLAHHLRVLQEAGVVRRVQSEGDRRRAYVQLRLDDPLVRATVGPPAVPRGARVVFVCTAQLGPLPAGGRGLWNASATSRWPRRARIRRPGCTRRRSPPAAGTAFAWAGRGPRTWRTSSATATWSSRCATRRMRNSTRHCAAALVDPRPGADRHRRGVRRRLRRHQPPHRRSGRHRHDHARTESDRVRTS